MADYGILRPFEKIYCLFNVGDVSYCLEIGINNNFFNEQNNKTKTMTKVVYLHFSNNRIITEITTKKEATVGSIIKEHASKDASNPDYEEDLEVSIENSDEELSKDATLEKLKIKDGEHLHFSRCKKVAVSINYNGTTFQHNFGSSKTIDTVRKKALEHFHISEQDGASLSLFLTSACDEAIPGNEHIGSFTGYPTCGVTLFLAKKKTIQG